MVSWEISFQMRAKKDSFQKWEKKKRRREKKKNILQKNANNNDSPQKAYLFPPVADVDEALQRSSKSSEGDAATSVSAHHACATSKRERRMPTQDLRVSYK